MILDQTERPFILVHRLLFWVLQAQVDTLDFRSGYTSVRKLLRHVLCDSFVEAKPQGKKRRTLKTLGHIRDLFNREIGSENSRVQKSPSGLWQEKMWVARYHKLQFIQKFDWNKPEMVAFDNTSVLSSVFTLFLKTIIWFSKNPNTYSRKNIHGCPVMKNETQESTQWVDIRKWKIKWIDLKINAALCFTLSEKEIQRARGQNICVWVWGYLIVVLIKLITM